MNLPKLSSSLSKTSLHQSNEKSNSNRETLSSNLRNRIMKKVLLSRKAKFDDLYDVSETSASELSQIKEEKTGNIEDFSQNEQTDIVSSVPSNLTQLVQKPINIFQEEVLSSPHYKEHNRGPQYRNDRIVKHSLLGTPDSYEKVKRTVNKLVPNLEPDSELISSKIMKRASFIIVNFENTLLRGKSTTSISSTQMPPKRSSIRKESFKEKREKRDQKEIGISREELQERIDKMHNSQEGFYQTQAKEYSSLPLRERITQTREERCLKKYEDTTAEWEKRSNTIARRIGRTPGGSVMLRGESFRQKKEIADFLEASKTEKERLGDSYWSTTLRSYPENEKLNQTNQATSAKDIGAFAPLKSYRSKTPFQVIRKTLLGGDMMSTTRYLEQTRVIDRTSKEYMQKKLSATDLMRKIKDPFVSQIDSLKVEGKNKLDMEASAVLGGDDYRQTFYFPKKFVLGHNPETVNKVIEENYERHSLVRTGFSGQLCLRNILS